MINFINREDLSAMEKILWITLHNYSNENQECIVSSTLLCKKLRVSKNTLTKYLKLLESKNGIYIFKRFEADTNRQLENKYFINDIDENGYFKHIKNY